MAVNVPTHPNPAHLQHCDRYIHMLKHVHPSQWTPTVIMLTSSLKYHHRSAVRAIKLSKSINTQSKTCRLIAIFALPPTTCLVTFSTFLPRYAQGATIEQCFFFPGMSIIAVSGKWRSEILGHVSMRGKLRITSQLIVLPSNS
jgi:hypothetical protein